MIDWDKEPLFHFAVEVFLAGWVVLFLALAFSPRLRQGSRWGKSGKGIPVSLYGVLAWSGFGAAMLVTHEMAFRWGFRGPSSMIPGLLGFINLSAAGFFDWYADSRRKKTGSTACNDIPPPVTK